jgi:two-component system, OmpR family, phosphate regulon response regulator OmpR
VLVAPSTPATTPACHLFVVERDAALRALLCQCLTQQGWATSGLGGAEALLAQVAHLRPDVVVMGASAGSLGVVEACRQLRGRGEVMPVILLAEAGDTDTRTAGLQAGADACLDKPLTARALVASVQALLHRTGHSVHALAATSMPSAATPAPCRIGQFTFVPQTRSLHGEDRVSALSDMELGVLLELVSNAGKPVPRERMLRRAGRGDTDLRPRAVDTAVMRLRRLLEPDPAEPRYLQTVRGRGYMFVPPMPTFG